MERRNFLLSLLAPPLCGGLAARAFAGQGGTTAAPQVDVEKYRAAALARWGDAVSELEKKDKVERHPEGSILFVGSSSIRRWDEIGADMAPYHAIQRGYGGARWSDVAVFAERLVSPHAFRAVVFFVGNDISGREDDKSPEEVAGLFSYVLGKVREHDADAPVFYIAVTPTPSRFDAWPEIKAANSAVRELCARTPEVYFIGTESIFLDAAGQPRPELFVEDELHLNRDGYALWAAAIKSQLDSVLAGGS